MQRPEVTQHNDSTLVDSYTDTLSTLYFRVNYHTLISKLKNSLFPFHFHSQLEYIHLLVLKGTSLRNGIFKTLIPIFPNNDRKNESVIDPLPSTAY